MAPSSAWQCPICLDTFERPVLATCCGQSFCGDCLDAALRKADACPMCRSPLLSGAFSATPNRALADALADVANARSSASSPPGSAAKGDSARSGPGDGERRSPATRSTEERGGLQRALRGSSTSDPTEGEATPSPTRTESPNSVLLAPDDPQRGTGTWRASLTITIRSWRIRHASCWRQAQRSRVSLSASGSARVRMLRRQLQQWWHWGRVHWTSLQCLFYVALFVVFVIFLRVEEDEFASATTNLRHRPRSHP